MPMPMTFLQAYREAAPILSGAAARDLVAGANDAGVLDRLREPTTLVALTDRSGLAPGIVGALVSALEAAGVVESDGSTLRLSAAWATLTGGGSLANLSDVLALSEVEGRLLRGLASGNDYWSMPTQDRLAYARGISPNPFSEAVVAGFRAAAAHDPDAGLLAAGGDYLELGCGVAGRLLVCLQAYPALRAVGVELSGELAAEARQRSVQLGLERRLEVVEQDAGTFDPGRTFDFAFWSQFFFAQSTRAAALATMFRCLRPGGVAWSPCVTDFEANDADPDGPAARLYAVRRVLLASWGVPERRPEALVTEYEIAGFVDVEVLGGGPLGPPRVRAVRP